MIVFGSPSSARICSARSRTSGLSARLSISPTSIEIGNASGAHLAAVDLDDVAARPQAQQVAGQPQEVLRAQRALEADQVRAEQPAEDLDAARQLHEQLDRRERDVQEEADPQVRTLCAQHRRHELQLVVLHPHGGAAVGDRGGRVGEPLVDPR